MGFNVKCGRFSATLVYMEYFVSNTVLKNVAKNDSSRLYLQRIIDD